MGPCVRISPYQVCETRIAEFLAFPPSVQSCPLEDRLTDTVPSVVQGGRDALGR